MEQIGLWFDTSFPPKVRQKVVRYVGTATSDAQLQLMKLNGQTLIEQLRQEESIQPVLFSPKKMAELAIQNRQADKRPVPADVLLNNCREESRISLGLRERLAGGAKERAQNVDETRR